MTTTVSDAPQSAVPETGERPPGGPAAATAAKRFVREQRPFLAVSAVFCALFLSTVARQPWGDDLTLHLAVLRRLLGNPWNPGDPVLDLPGGSVYYSPYTVSMALIGKPLGIGAYTLLRLAAAVNLVLLLSGVYRFTRSLSRARWAPALAVLGLGTWWGTTAYAFSGFLPLDSLADCLAYPSTVGTALALHLWAGLNRAKVRKRSLAGLGALLGMLLLVHEFSGLSAVMGCIAILASRHRELRSRDGVKAVLAGVGGCAAVILAWPYYHLWSVGQGDLNQLDAVHHVLYLHILNWYGLAMPGVAAIAWRWWRNRTDTLALMFFGIGAVVLFGAITQHWSYGRTWPMVIVVWQAAIAVTVAELGPGRLRRFAVGGVAVITGFGLWAQADLVTYALPTPLQHAAVDVIGKHSGIELIPHETWLDRYLKPSDVVVADYPETQFEVAAHGSYNLATPWYLPELSVAAIDARADDVAMLLDAGTAPAQRAAIIAKYHVTWVLLFTFEQLPSDFPGQKVAAEGGFVLYRVTGS